jgi:hypothetical protein
MKRSDSAEDLFWGTESECLDAARPRERPEATEAVPTDK